MAAVAQHLVSSNLCSPAQHGRGFCARLDHGPVICLDIRRGRNPGASDRDDIGMGEPLARIVLPDAAGCTEAHLRKWPGERIQGRKPSGRHGRKKLNEIKAARDTGDKIRCRLDTGHERQIAGCSRLKQLDRLARTDRKRRAHLSNRLKIARRQHSADADDGLRHLSDDGAGSIDRGFRAQRDLDDGQPARDECTREWHRLAGMLDGDDGYHRRQREDFPETDTRCFRYHGLPSAINCEQGTMQLTVARVSANWMFFSTAMRVCCLTSTSWDITDQESMKNTGASARPSAMRAPICRSPPNGSNTCKPVLPVAIKVHLARCVLRSSAQAANSPFLAPRAISAMGNFSNNPGFTRLAS